MSHSQICYEELSLKHAWLNLWDKHMTTGRINQVFTWLLTPGRHCYPGRHRFSKVLAAVLTEVQQQIPKGNCSVWVTLPQTRHQMQQFLNAHSASRCCTVPPDRRLRGTTARIDRVQPGIAPSPEWCLLCSLDQSVPGPVGSAAGRANILPPIVVTFCENRRLGQGENPKVAKSKSKSNLQGWGAKNTTPPQIQPQGLTESPVGSISISILQLWKFRRGDPEKINY